MFLIDINFTACYQTTLRQNRETIIGEIEDDIIEDTMNEVKEMRRDTMLKSTECFSGYKSRRRKAIAFLQYVLCNEDVLLAFEMAFTFRSQVHMDIIKCRKCEDRNGKPMKIINSYHLCFLTKMVFRVPVG